MTLFTEIEFDELTFQLPGTCLWIADTLAGTARIAIEDGVWWVSEVDVKGVAGPGKHAADASHTFHCRVNEAPTDVSSYGPKFVEAIEIALRLTREDDIDELVHETIHAPREYEKDVA